MYDRKPPFHQKLNLKKKKTLRFKKIILVEQRNRRLKYLAGTGSGAFPQSKLRGGWV